MDVYADWVDACDAVAKADGQELSGGGDAPLRAPASARNVGGRARDEDEDENLDDLIDDADDAGYARDNDGVAVDDDY